MNNKKLLFLYIFSLLFFELIFHIVNFREANYKYIIFFTTILSLDIYTLINFFKPKTMKIITFILFIIIFIYFISQLIYFQTYHAIFSIDSITMAGQILNFHDEIAIIIFDNIVFIILLCYPIFMLIYCNKKYILFCKNKSRRKIPILVLLFILNSLFTSSLTKSNENIYSLYDIYHNINSPILTTKNFGLFTQTKLNIKRNIFGFNSSLNNLTTNNIEGENVILNDNMNVIDIDFKKYIKENKNEDDQTLSIMHEYFLNQLPSEKNKYTGILKEKNIIFILAESLDRIAINKDITPTLYKLSNEGFQFTNYYTPLYPTSTADGEYMTEWSILPRVGNQKNLFYSRNNYNRYGFVESFKNLGYLVSAYHNYTYDFYERGIYWESQGYDIVKFCDTGLNLPCDDNFHGSDITMIKKSINDYIDEEKFFTFYITLSGHGQYDYNNPFVKKYRKYVDNLPYDDSLKNYLSVNVELDKALEILIKELEKKNKLNDTVIIITPDHWPYLINNNNLNQIDTIDRNKTYQIHRENLIIWNPELPNIVVDKVSSNIDILPTLLNLMGIEYDSRLLIGKDILSTEEGLVIFSDYGWITDKGTYNGETGEFIVNNDVVIENDYVEAINKIVKNKFQISSLIQEYDYYSVIFDKNTGVPYYINDK